jgi:prepilin-type N-terminal cleavage/methylation domain-containing protein
MRCAGFSSRRNGFSLVELLVVMVILGLVIASIYGLFIANQRTAYNQGEVVDVQQSLRVAMDMIERDIHLAGFLVSGNPVVNAPADPDDANRLTLQTASAFGTVARIADTFSVPSALSGTEGTFKVASAEMASLFDIGDVVRIVRPANSAQPISRTFTVSGVQPAASPPTITLDTFLPASDSADFVEGDMIVRTTSSAPDPDIIEYFRDGNQIKREGDNGGAQVVADHITDLECKYLSEKGTETAVLADIRAVQVTITGATSGALSEGQPRVRTLTNVFAIKN